MAAGSGIEGGSPVGARPSQVISQHATSNAIGATQAFAYPRAVPEVLRLLRGAERSVRMMAYTLDHQGALVSLEALARRGSTVRREAAFVRALLMAGGVVRTFSAKQRYKMATKKQGAFSPHLHAKAGIVDDGKVWIGSLNMTHNSEGWFEIITTSSEANVVEELRGVFTLWWALGEELSLEALATLEAGMASRGASVGDRGSAEV